MAQFTTISEILEAVKEEELDFIRFHFSDADGVFKELDVPPALLESAFSKGLPFDNSVGGTFKPTGSDLMLKPDPRTFSILDYGRQNYGRVVCELTFLDGQPFDGCVRSALKLFVRKIYQAGYTFSVSSSLSFYLFDASFVASGESFSPSPETIMKTEAVKREILSALNVAEIDIVSLRQMHQGGPISIVFKEGSVLRTADNIMTAKYLVTDVARRHNLHASFMPKPATTMEGLTTTFGFTLMKDEFNEFYHPDQEMMISDKARGFIAGIFKHIRAICAVTNPTVNSYKRIVQKGKAPYYVSWSAVDRHSLIRLPSSRGRATRIEVQNADSSCNPYLSLLVLIAAGISGIDDNLKTIPAVNFETHDYSESEKQALSAGTLPNTLREALLAFNNDALIREALSDSISSSIYQTGIFEWSDYIGCVHTWELEKYL
ncbi:glutamine synthetase family protein [Methanimicrococcus blatticola]|uniref:L-glutamine synthetase n=1 Tax=Methanimicrococcus blatticola TaxID=91560 RepID=A0A484F7K2_9EURY|nr:glutamine synthetase family protein [Methanimicrococcus blatticola]MBZ3935441.1 glutamine synthetase family protein [Methanimicrococcus blatticola]MCC2509085.1 glutamine synthetase family protein [Methanimicrococcus blatticola]TDQ69544.1 L-glutamine synthetase [Methanimicrococcus blatticola]